MTTPDRCERCGRTERIMAARPSVDKPRIMCLDCMNKELPSPHPFRSREEIEKKFGNLSIFKLYNPDEVWQNSSEDSETIKIFIQITRLADLNAVIAMVEGMKKVCGGDLQMNDEYEQCHGYNQALTDLLTKLEEWRKLV